MKLLTLLFAIGFAGVTLAVPFGNGQSDFNEEGWLVPEVNGKFRWVSKVQLDFEARQPRAATVVKYYLYTKSNPSSPQEIISGNPSSLSKSNFNKNNPTRIITHGWQSYLSDVNVDVRNAFLAKGSFNIIAVDWSSAAQTVNYNSARNSVSDVGQQIAAFADFLNSSGGMSFGTLFLIGHSLGAHCSGFAGKNVKRGKVNTIIGLDPALPGFSYSDPSSRLSSTDATYVESIQTNGGLLGFLDPIGKAAFYPNGGKSQPGCGLDVSGGCAHSRSYQYYSESVMKNDFPSMRCGTYQNAVAKNCGNNYSGVKMGAPTNIGSASGYYYVPVNSASPYGMG